MTNERGNTGKSEEQEIPNGIIMLVTRVIHDVLKAYDNGDLETLLSLTGGELHDELAAVSRRDMQLASIRMTKQRGYFTSISLAPSSCDGKVFNADATVVYGTDRPLVRISFEIIFEKISNLWKVCRIHPLITPPK